MNSPFLYRLKTSEDRCFQGVEKGYIETNGLNQKPMLNLVKAYISVYSLKENDYASCDTFF